MEHFILFAIALTVIAFVSVLCAKPTTVSNSETEHQPTPILLSKKSIDSNSQVNNRQEPEFQFLANQFSSVNKLIHEKNWI